MAGDTRTTYPPYLDLPKEDFSNTKFKIGEEVTAFGSSIIHIIKRIFKNNGEIIYELDNRQEAKEKDLNKVIIPHLNQTHFRIGDNVECIHGYWTNGKVIGYDQDVYLYIKVGKESVHCHFDDIRLIHPRQPRLADTLKEHIGEMFYSPMLGYMELQRVDEALHFRFDTSTVTIAPDGTDERGNLCIFPSKEEMDWEKWLRYANPSTWPDIVNSEKYKTIDDLKDIVKMENDNNVSNEQVNFAKLIFLLRNCYDRHDKSDKEVKRFLSEEENIELLNTLLNTIE